ncbi:MAG: DMT family transporter [Candidatus Doudnabacteria bacterium]|nr:DMT family transporter [Candidatus Doudnabacteria bacterium]
MRQSWLVLLINGLIMLGLSKIFWLEAIHRISVVKANALSSMGPLATLFFAWIILRDAPTSWQLLSIVPMIFGVVLLGEEKNT